MRHQKVQLGRARDSELTETETEEQVDVTQVSLECLTETTGFGRNETQIELLQQASLTTHDDPIRLQWGGLFCIAVSEWLHQA